MMRLDGYFNPGAISTTDRKESKAMPFGVMAFFPVAIDATSQWAEIYRIARERTFEALRPTRYDQVCRVTSN